MVTTNKTPDQGTFDFSKIEKSTILTINKEVNPLIQVGRSATLICRSFHLQMAATVCCRCKTGSCKSCSCAKASKPCADCLPSREGHCMNDHSSSTQQTTLPQTSVTQSSPQSNIAVDNTAPLTRPTLNTSADLPSFTPMSVPSFLWGELSGQDRAKQLIKCYNETQPGDTTSSRFPRGRQVMNLSKRFPDCFTLMLKLPPLSQSL